MALRLAGETPSVVQGLDQQGWPRFASPGTVDLREGLLGRPRTGAYYLSYPFWLRDGYSTTAIVANNLYATPLWVPRKAAIDGIAVNIITGTGNPAHKARLGIYKDGTNLAPGSLLADAGEVAVDTAGVKAITVSWAVSGGLYWLALVSDATPSVMYTTTDRIPLLGFRASDFAWNYVAWTVAQAYGALPGSFPASPTVDESLYGIAVRFSSLD